MREIFDSWRVSYQVEYLTPEEETYRLGVFSDNYNRIIDLNASQREFKAGINSFADLTNEEFRAKYTMS